MTCHLMYYVTSNVPCSMMGLAWIYIFRACLPTIVLVLSYNHECHIYSIRSIVDRDSWLYLLFCVAQLKDSLPRQYLVFHEQFPRFLDPRFRAILRPKKREKTKKKTPRSSRRPRTDPTTQQFRTKQATQRKIRLKAQREEYSVSFSETKISLFSSFPLS